MTKDNADRYTWHDRTVIDSDGKKVGKIEHVWDDPATGHAEWATVATGLFGTKSNFVPLSGASPDGDDVRVPVTKNQVKDAPGVERDGEFSAAEERRLYEHYGIPHDDEDVPGRPADGRAETAGRADTTPADPGRSDTTHAGAGGDADRADVTTTRSSGTSDDGGRGGRSRLRRYIVTRTIVTEVPSDRREDIADSRTPFTH